MEGYLYDGLEGRVSRRERGKEMWDWQVGGKTTKRVHVKEASVIDTHCHTQAASFQPSVVYQLATPTRLQDRC